MTPKIIELKQAPVVLVELEDAPIKVWDSFANGFIYTEIDGYIETFYLDDICLDSKCMGLLSNITEEQFAECVAKPHFSQFFSAKVGPFYTDYSNQGRSMMTAKYSWDTLLESEKVYVGVNPYEGMPPDIRDFIDCGPKSEYMAAYEKSVEDFSEAESRTIDPTRTVVLIRKEEQK